MALNVALAGLSSTAANTNLAQRSLEKFSPDEMFTRRNFAALMDTSANVNVARGDLAKTIDSLPLNHRSGLNAMLQDLDAVDRDVNSAIRGWATKDVRGTLTQDIRGAWSGLEHVSGAFSNLHLPPTELATSASHAAGGGRIAGAAVVGALLIGGGIAAYAATRS